MKTFSIKKASAKATGIGIATLAIAQTVWAASVPDSLENGLNAAKPTGAENNLFENGGLFQTIANALIFLVGAVSVIMLIVGGLRYVLSAGNASSVEGAKNTILFAIIGVIVAALSYAIVAFVVGRLGAA